MTAEQFIYWLQGFSEINRGCPSPDQWTIIQDHLKTFFKKETPDRQPKQEPGSQQKPFDLQKVLDDFQKQNEKERGIPRPYGWPHRDPWLLDPSYWQEPPFRITC